MIDVLFAEPIIATAIKHGARTVMPDLIGHPVFTLDSRFGGNDNSCDVLLHQ